MTQSTKQGKAEFRKGDRVRCVICKKVRVITAVKDWEGTPLYRLGREPFGNYGGHLGTELRHEKGRNEQPTSKSPEEHLDE